jgi:hypothetical protein
LCTQLNVKYLLQNNVLPYLQFNFQNVGRQLVLNCAREQWYLTGVREDSLLGTQKHLMVYVKTGKEIYYFVINNEQSGPDLRLVIGDPNARASHLINRSEQH